MQLQDSERVRRYGFSASLARLIEFSQLSNARLGENEQKLAVDGSQNAPCALLDQHVAKKNRPFFWAAKFRNSEHYGKARAQAQRP